MSYYGQQQAPPPAYAAPGQSYASQTYPPPVYVVAPPAGYPMKDGPGYPQQQPAVETKKRGDGFWKGCCAALCCCCLADMCF